MVLSWVRVEGGRAWGSSWSGGEAPRAPAPGSAMAPGKGQSGHTGAHSEAGPQAVPFPGLRLPALASCALAEHTKECFL